MNRRAQYRSTAAWLGVVSLSVIGGAITAVGLCIALSSVLLLLKTVLLPLRVL